MDQILKDHTLWVVGTLNPDTDEAMPRGVIEVGGLRNLQRCTTMSRDARCYAKFVLWQGLVSLPYKGVNLHIPRLKLT